MLACRLPHPAGRPRGLAKRVIACLDVRANDSGDLVVTKGDQYDVRETGSTGEVSGQGRQLRRRWRAARHGKEQCGRREGQGGSLEACGCPGAALAALLVPHSEEL